MTRSFIYRFTSQSHTSSYRHELGADSLHLHHDGQPDWTRLGYHQCEGCEWTQSQHCPVAVGLVEPAKLLGTLNSYEPVTVEVETIERTYRKETTAQEGLSALFGLIMASSGCPNFSYLKGLAYYHLPFASYEETLYRAIMGYMMHHHLQEVSVTREKMIEDLRLFYDRLKEMNIAVTKRLREGAAPQTDSPMNAVVILDSFGGLVPMTMEEGLKKLEAIFV